MNEPTPKRRAGGRDRGGHAARGVAAARPLGAFALLSALTLVLLLPQPAVAHTVSVGQSKIRQEGNTVHYDLAVEYDHLVRVIGLSPLPRDATDAERLERLGMVRGELEAHLGQRVRVFLDGVGCQESLGLIEIVHHEGVVYAVTELSYQCPGSPWGSFEVYYDLLYFSIHPHRLTHWNYADYELAGEEGSLVFARGEERLLVAGASPFTSAGRFLAVGLEHLLSGLPYVLFLLALLLGARSLRDGAKLVAAFTAAHSVTLVLAAMGWVHVPSRAVEFLIVLSIGYVAITNILWRDSAHRVFGVFGCGLVHGLGFAGALTFADQASLPWAASVLGFLAGVELGQALVILLACPLLLLGHWLVRGPRAKDIPREPDPTGGRRRTPHAELQRFAQRGASGLIAGAGLLLLVERLVLG